MRRRPRTSPPRATGGGALSCPDATAAPTGARVHGERRRSYMAEDGGGLGADVVEAYLQRLGLEREPRSAQALARLVHRHVERVPYETMWIAAGEAWGIGALDAAHRIARDRRGGYCYHLNGGLGALLTSLGYEVHRHAGGVHGPDGPSA